jgi:hypothetical protein
MVRPDFMESNAAKFTIRNNALCIFAIHQFPRLAHRDAFRECPREKGFEFATTPHSFHVQWLKCQALGLHI